MSVQEETREGIAEDLFWRDWNRGLIQGNNQWAKQSDETRARYKEDATFLMKKPASQGVVIKVDRELPEITKQEVGVFLKAELGYSDIAIGLMRDDIAKYIRKKVKKITAGYVATEGLIEDV